MIDQAELVRIRRQIDKSFSFTQRKEIPLREVGIAEIALELCDSWTDQDARLTLANQERDSYLRENAELRARLERAEKERGEALNSSKATLEERNQIRGICAFLEQSNAELRAERDEARREREEWRERADRAEAALGVAETFCVMGIFSDYCSVCHQPKTSNHKDTCPFRVLAGREPAGDTK